MIFLLGLLLGMLIAKRNDVSKMFTGADGKIKYKKVAMMFIFVLIGIPLAIRTHRREKSINFGFTMVLFLLYWGIMLGSVACVVHNTIPPWAGIWMANAVFFVVGIILFLKMGKK